MGKLDDLNFVKKAPVISVNKGASPVEKARKKLVAEIEHQISLAADPNYEIVTTNRNNEETRRNPKSWIVVDGETAFITIRYSNIAVPLGGKRGGVIKCSVENVPDALRTVRDAIKEGEVDEILEKMIAKAKRKPRRKTATASPAAQPSIQTGDGTS